MSNHHHLVIKIDSTQAKPWPDKEVAKRWTTIYRAPLLIKRWLTGDSSLTETQTIQSIIHLWRKRLCDIVGFLPVF